jgi:hypothetical protein
MDLDMDHGHRMPRFPLRKLEFVDADALGLGSLDLTFDAEPSANGKIRVRIHNPTSVSPSPTSSSPSSFSPSPPALHHSSASSPADPNPPLEYPKNRHTNDLLPGERSAATSSSGNIMPQYGTRLNVLAQPLRTRAKRKYTGVSDVGCVPHEYQIGT